MHYSREDACRAWLTYGTLAYDLLRDLLYEYGTAEKIYDEFVRTGGQSFQQQLPPESFALLKKQSDKGKMHAMLEVMKKFDMGIMSQDDEGYPSELLNINDPPFYLFYIGNLDALNGRCITMVGSRHASIAGLEATQTIARELSEQGVRVVSGMAQGIDQAAHTGCLEGSSPTIAVAGCGLDLHYPADSDDLRARILKQDGLLLSEYAPGAPALSWHFPVRNRILSGLSKAVVMMECRIKSGSMSTVTHALDQGKEVFAWPGHACTDWAEGAHQLLREGARYFAFASDLLEDLDWQHLKPPTKEQAAALPPLSDDQKLIYQQLKRGEQSMDELVYATKLEVPTLASALTMLQILGLVKPLPGKRYQAL